MLNLISPGSGIEVQSLMFEFIIINQEQVWQETS